jgi:hypothetical protein
MQACTNGSSGAVTLTLDSFGAASTSTWYFFAFGHDPTNNVLWGSINNGTVDTTSFSGGLFSGTQGLRIGIDSGSGNPVDGAIDEVGLWGKRPSADELSELYNSGNAKTCCPFS